MFAMLHHPDNPENNLSKIFQGSLISKSNLAITDGIFASFTTRYTISMAWTA